MESQRTAWEQQGLEHTGVGTTGGSWSELEAGGGHPPGHALNNWNSATREGGCGKAENHQLREETR